MSRTTWKAGELAKATGLTVRTLHHYDQVGLLSPSQRSEAGYRLYDAHDVARLQTIRSLRALGLSLADIRSCLDRDACAPRHTIARHLARLRQQIALQEELCRQLEGLARYLDSREEPPAEAFIRTMEVMAVIEKYYTEQQLKELEERRRKVGEERIRQVEAEWPALIAAVRAEMDKGTDPADPHVRELAHRWQGLIAKFTGGNPEIEQSLRRMYEQEPSVRAQAGVDPQIMEYVGRAMAAASTAS